MFDKLDGILERYDEIMEQLNDPNVVSDQNNFRKLDEGTKRPCTNS